MNGIVQGTELDRLVVLRAQVDARIEQLRRAEVHNGGAILPVPTSAEALMATLGVTSRQVKEWAVQHGLLACVRRGRVSLTIVQAYQRTHEGHP